MFQLRCTVRNCQATLKLHEKGLTCPHGHHFDRAKEGYWSLIQPQDRKSTKAGDTDTAVLARHRWLQRGNAHELMKSLKPWVTQALACSLSNSTSVPGPPRILDLGCGEGSFGPALFGGYAKSYCGIDLSKRAVRLAARGWPDATWVLANADRTLPIHNESVDCAVSLFGRRPVSELARILKRNGKCIIAVPAEDDLIELREKTQNAGHRRSRWQTIVSEFGSAGYQFLEHQLWRQQMNLDREAITDALAMTYRAARYSQQSKLESVSEMKVTLAADLLLFARTT
ncbi:MAG: SAM-dependent methyltransferase [Rhodopirellula sp.]|nr:SAM-dependent methyltransferase [Rhodopirellula sp.]